MVLNIFQNWMSNGGGLIAKEVNFKYRSQFFVE